MVVFLIVLSLIISYLLGSISFAVIFSKIFTKKDVRNYGSGNAGMTNVMRVSGAVPGTLTFLCDVLKGFIASTIGFYIFAYCFKIAPIDLLFPRYGCYYCGIVCMIGHIFPVFFGFKGGKAVAVSLGVLIASVWPTGLIALAVFIICFLCTRIVSIGSIMASVSVPITAFLFSFKDGYQFALGDSSCGRLQIFILTLIMAIIVICMHRDNIKRILNGTEKKLTLRRKNHG